MVLDFNIIVLQEDMTELRIKASCRLSKRFPPAEQLLDAGQAVFSEVF